MMLGEEVHLQGELYGEIKKGESTWFLGETEVRCSQLQCTNADTC